MTLKNLKEYSNLLLVYPSDLIIDNFGLVKLAGKAHQKICYSSCHIADIFPELSDEIERANSFRELELGERKTINIKSEEFEFFKIDPLFIYVKVSPKGKCNINESKEQNDLFKHPDGTDEENELLLLRTILDQISDAVHVSDENGRVVFLNKEAQQRIGLTFNRESKLNVMDVSRSFGTLDDFKKHVSDLRETGVVVTESRHKNLETGIEYPTELSVRYGELNGKGYIFATGRDITQRLKDRQEIKEREKHISDLNFAINSSSLVSITDSHGNILDVNDKFCEVSQYSRAELIGSNHRIVSSNSHTQEFWRDFFATISSGQTWVGEICNKKKSGEVYWVRTVIYPILDDSGKPLRFMSIRQEITREKEAEKQILKHLNFQELLVNIALEMINVNPEDLDLTINKALEKIGVFVEADRSYIFNYDRENETSSNLYEWCHEGVVPQIEKLQNVPFSDMPEWIDRHFKGEIMDIPSVAELPDSLLKELLEVQDIKSLIALPLMDGNVCTGFVGFDSVRSVHPFTENDKQILQLFSHILVNIQKRIQSIRLVEHANQQIKDINSGLNKRIAEEMDKTSQLTQSMANLDKMAMVGELTSGLAHDLNTPLGAIKVGAEGVRYILENLFKSVLEGNSIEQIHFACSRAVESDYTMFVGGLQTLKESKAMADYLERNYSELPNKSELIKSMVKARITVDEPDVIDTIMQSENRSEFLELIYHIQAVRTFTDTILEAGDKAKSVVDSLRFYIKEGSDQPTTDIQIKDNVMKVVNVFNHLIKQYDINLRVDMQDGTIIRGVPERLYQLWSNLLKNAIDATGFNGNITITSKVIGNDLAINIENTGNTIPEEVKQKIWKKFFTTKSGNGTGLGLSIVKRIVEEHDAQIELSSENDRTIFCVCFPLVIK